MSYDYTYYANSLKRTFTGPDSQTLTYFYDAGNRLSNISILGQRNITYNTYQWNSPTQISRPGGSSTDLTYDPLMQVKTITAKDPAQNAVMLRDYTYAPSGNITQKATEHGIYGYEYDELHRLTGAVNPTLPDEAYTYDKLGNRLTSAQTTGNWTYNANNELQGYDDVSFNYDLNGNLTTKTKGVNTTQYSYDVEDRLSEVRDGSDNLIASYYYDPFGRRLWKDVDGTKTYFLYSDEGLVGEYDATGQEIKTYGWAPDSTWGTNPLFVKITSAYYWYQNDAQGTPQKIIGTNGSVVWAATYDSFGNCQVDIETIVNNIRFPGQYFDAETGLYYNYNRYYDPTTSRYLRTDPFGDGQNLYVYVFANPVNFIDPMGLCAVNKVQENINNIKDFVQQEIEDYIGNEPGDIFTFGFSGGFMIGWVPVGLAFSADRVVMQNGEVDWFITGGLGVSSHGFSAGMDRGKVWTVETTEDIERLKSNNMNDWYDFTHNITKEDIKGPSISTNVDVITPYFVGVGGEVAFAPLSNAVTAKWGPRAGKTPGANIIFNWTIDIGK